jgi:hypothetical protein
MPEFLETNDFPITARLVEELWLGAKALGWEAFGGTLVGPGSSVSPALLHETPGLSCRFELGSEIVVLHVYSDPDEPTASLTLPQNPSRHCAEFLAMVSRIAGVHMYREASEQENLALVDHGELAKRLAPRAPWKVRWLRDHPEEVLRPEDGEIESLRTKTGIRFRYRFRSGPDE